MRDSRGRRIPRTGLTTTATFAAGREKLRNNLYRDTAPQEEEVRQAGAGLRVRIRIPEQASAPEKVIRQGRIEIEQRTVWLARHKKEKGWPLEKAGIYCCRAKFPFVIPRRSTTKPKP